MTSKRFCGLPFAGVVLMAVLGVAFSAAAQVAPSSPSKIYPGIQVQVPAAQVRSWQEMEAAGALSAAAPASAAREKKPFRTPMGLPAYRDTKAKAAQPGGPLAPPAPQLMSAVPLEAAPITNAVNFEGVAMTTAGGWYPPDTHGAVGPNHFVEVTNSHLDIYLKAAPHTLVKSVSLSSFLGATANSLTDPRMIYDQDFGRWVFCISQFRQSSTVQQVYLAVSQTSDPTGSFYITPVNVSAGANTFWDYPQLGMDRNAVIVTGDLYTANYLDSRMFAVPKSLLYNNQSFTLQVFTGLKGTLAPPVVLDTNPNTYLVYAAPSDNKVTLYTLTNSATAPALVSATIPVPAYTLPPNAAQPGTTQTLDALDSRFLNASTQVGNSLFQVHTINIGGFARPRFYEFDTVNKQVIQSGTFSRSGTSYDFNASIAANRKKDVFVTWSATDPTNNVNAEVRYSGRLHSEPQGAIPSPGSLLIGSASNLTGQTSSWDPNVQRWGDYSAVTLDPADATQMTAWIVNERLLSTSTWGSRIGSISLPSYDSTSAINLLLLSD